MTVPVIFVLRGSYDNSERGEDVMRKTSRNMFPLRYMTILKGTLIASICSVAICAAVALCILNERIRYNVMAWMSMPILFVSSYLGAKYSYMKANEHRYLYASITGIAFILLLMIINISVLDNSMNDILPKIITALTGAALASFEFRRKGRGRGAKRHRRNC